MIRDLTEDRQSTGPLTILESLAGAPHDTVVVGVACGRTAWGDGFRLILGAMEGNEMVGGTLGSPETVCPAEGSIMLGAPATDREGWRPAAAG